MENKIYAGVGSRKTPLYYLDMMTCLATKLELLGYLSRSGDADGADKAFARGVKDKKNIERYIPWKGFNGSDSPLYHKPSKEAYDIASKHHKRWNYLDESVKKLMARNVYQILGLDLNTPVDFVICWTPCGSQTDKQRSIKTGGTGLAISLADSLGIKVYNLANNFSHSKMYDLLHDIE